jgi:hypothetical protein
VVPTLDAKSASRMGHPHFLGLRDLHIKIEEWGARLRFAGWQALLRRDCYQDQGVGGQG